MIEKREYHPYGNYIPPKTRVLIIGSFPISKFTDPLKKKEIKTNEINFFFGGERNLLWNLFGRIFGKKLTNKKEIECFLIQHHLGIVDLVASCRRKKGSSSDSALYDIKWNKDLEKIIKNCSIEELIFTSKTVEKWFKHLHPNVKIPTLTLISPSSQSQRALGGNEDYIKWKKEHPNRKPIDFIELSYRRRLLKII